MYSLHSNNVISFILVSTLFSDLIMFQFMLDYSKLYQGIQKRYYGVYLLNQVLKILLYNILLQFHIHKFCSMMKLIGGFQKLVVTVFDCIVICFIGDKFLKIYSTRKYTIHHYDTIRIYLQCSNTKNSITYHFYRYLLHKKC